MIEISTFESALTVELRTVAALDNRIYSHTEPEERFDLTKPYLIFITNEGLRTKELTGYKSGKVVRGELNVIAPEYLNVKSIAPQVIDKIVSFEGRVIGGDGPYIQEITYEQPVELFEDKPRLYRCVIDFEVYF